jgi:predicted metal-dependent hydrolase
MQQKQVILSCQKINYTLKRYKRQRRVNFIIHQDGSLVITAPKKVNQKLIDNLITKNEKWIIKNIQQPKTLEISQQPKEISQAKKQARYLVENKLKLFNLHYQLTYKKITIRNQKTRWGSCSSNGSLNFNYKIIYLSEKLIDYIIVHELCHLEEMNHSPNFWNLVSEEIPDYKECRQELKKIRF